MEYTFHFDEDDVVDGTQSVTDEQFEQLNQPLPAIPSCNTDTRPHETTLATPPDSSVSPPPESNRSTTNGRRIPQQRPKSSQPKVTPPAIAALTNEEILKLSPRDGWKIMGERLLEFLLDYDAVRLQTVNQEKDHSRIAHAKGRALTARALTLGRTPQSVKAEFNREKEIRRRTLAEREKAAGEARSDVIVPSASKRPAGIADVDDGEERAPKKARKTVAATVEPAETQRAGSEVPMRELGYHPATLGGNQPYPDLYEQQEQVSSDPPGSPSRAQAMSTPGDGLWEFLLPFNTRHDEIGACIDHCCANGNGFSRLCSEEYMVSRRRSSSLSPHEYAMRDLQHDNVAVTEPMWSTYVRYHDDGTLGVFRGTQAVDCATQQVTNTTENQMIPLTRSDAGTQSYYNPVYPAPNSVSNQTNIPNHSYNGWNTDTSPCTNDNDILLSTNNISHEINSFAMNANNNFAMLATDQIPQSHSERSGLTMAVPSGGAMSSQHMLGQAVGLDELAAHRTQSFHGQESGAGLVSGQLLANDFQLDYGASSRADDFDIGFFEWDNMMD